MKRCNMLDSSSSDLPDPLLGKRIGNYILERRIGAGSEGCVYLAHHHQIEDLKVAIKLWNPDAQDLDEEELTTDEEEPEDEKAMRRFAQEADRLAKLRHPNIVPIWDFASEPFPSQ